MKKYWFILLCVGFTHTIWSQTGPGFLGKHWTVHYNYSFFGNYPKHFRDAATREFRFTDWINGRHDFELDYSNTRATSYGVGWSFAAGGFGQEGEAYSRNYTSQTFAIYRKKFNVENSGALAPIGRYRMFRILAVRSRYGLDENPAFFSNPVRRNEKTQINVGASIGWGRQVVLSGKLIANVGIEFGGLIARNEDDSFLSILDNIRTSFHETPFPVILFSHIIRFRAGLSWATF
ncbi:MAG: hypothetical protein AAGH79_08220 [Bacteroidota bacterium]